MEPASSVFTQVSGNKEQDRLPTYDGYIVEAMYRRPWVKLLRYPGLSDNTFNTKNHKQNFVFIKPSQTTHYEILNKISKNRAQGEHSKETVSQIQWHLDFVLQAQVCNNNMPAWLKCEEIILIIFFREIYWTLCSFKKILTA